MATLICYESKRFERRTLELIAQVVVVVEELVALGYDLTLRQLYYLMIARDLFPNSWIDKAYNLKNGLDPDTKNTIKNYKKFGRVVSEARRAGMVDWEAIVDRGRNLTAWSSWATPQDRLRAAASNYVMDLWNNQPYRPEVWVEKDALLGIFGQVCSRERVPYTSCRGYTSDSEIWAAAQRLRGYEHDGQIPVVLHFSDHDPSGLDMTKDIDKRLYLFAGQEIEVRRIAFTWEQVQQFNPPPNPAKETDSRFKQYSEQYGDDSWELDAIAPPALADIIRGAINDVRDNNLWDDAVAREGQGRTELSLLARHYTKALKHVTPRS